MRRTLALGVLAAVIASGCSTVEGNDEAASVGDDEVTIDDYESLLAAFAERPEITGLIEDPATGSVPSDDARNWLSLMVQNVASTEFLADHGEAVTDDDREAVRDTIADDNDLLQFSDEVVALFVDLEAAASAQARIAAPDAAELERRYSESPASLGVVCVRHILVDTEAAADDVVAELDAGADFARDLAAERSTDPSAAENGGALEGESGACLPIEPAGQQLDPTFVAAAATSSPGAPIGPVETSFGWHVIEARPFDEVAESLTGLFEQSAGELLFGGYLATADVRVDPRYGRWDGLTAAVVAL